jgi:hypothetical protein
MAEPPRKSRRISSKRSRALHIEDNQEVHIPAQSNTCRTAQSEGSDITEKIQAGIQAAIPDITNSVISALKVHGLTFPTTQGVNDTAVHAEPILTAHLCSLHRLLLRTKLQLILC